MLCRIPHVISLRNPFQIASIIVLLIPIQMIDNWHAMRVWDKMLGNKSMNIVHLSDAILAQAHGEIPLAVVGLRKYRDFGELHLVILEQNAGYGAKAAYNV